MKILYAEDERQLSMAVAEILNMEGHDVDAVYDGQEALEHLAKQSYDAAILDIMMPKKDGIQVLKEMRDKQDYLPVMLLTAKTQVEDRIEGLNIGADDYLGKPFDMRELIARLEAMVRRTVRYQESILREGNISLNCKTYELTSPVTSLMLNSSEAGLLEYFMKKPNGGFSLNDIKEQCFTKSTDFSTVRLYLSYIKNKLQYLQSDKNIILKGDRYYLL